MVLTVGTNSYVSLTEAEEYFASVIDASGWDTLDEASKEAALISATRYIDERPWIGSTVSPSQDLGWPRNGATYFDEKLGMIVTHSNTDIPERVKIAVYEQALYMVVNNDSLQATSQSFESITVGPISLSDSDSSKSISKSSSTATKMLKPLVKRGSTSNTWWRAW
jgi:hypothetical protein